MIKMLMIVALCALVLLIVVRLIADRMLRDNTHGPVSSQKLAQLSALTQEQVERSVTTKFARQLKGIEILELGAFGANIIEASLGEQKEAEPDPDTVENPMVEPGNDVVLSLRWRNTGEKPIRQAVFAIAFLSPKGEVLCPDALEKDPWMQQFGVAAMASFNGHFPKGQGKRQKDMKNAFLLYHGPVDDAVILGMKLTYEDGTVFEQSING